MTNDDCKEAIRMLDWEGAQRLWRRIRSGSTGEWPVGKAYEYLVLRTFELDGAEVTWPFSVRFEGREIEQIDGAVHIKWASFLVESKDYGARDVAFGPIAKLRAHLSRRHPSMFGVVFSRRGFTWPARLELGTLSPQNILLWCGDELNIALNKNQIVKLLWLKYRRCLECGDNDFDVRGHLAKNHGGDSADTSSINAKTANGAFPAKRRKLIR